MPPVLTAAKPLIIFDSLFLTTGAIITFSSEETNKPVSNLSDFFLNTFWGPTSADQSADSSSHVRIELPAGQDFDTLVIGNHDLFTAGIRVTLNHHPTNAFASPTQIDQFTPGDDLNLFQRFTLENRQFIELVFDNSPTAFSIGQIMITKALEMERRPIDGFSMLSQIANLETLTSKKGQYIAAVLQFVNRGLLLDFETLTKDFVFGDLKKYIDESYLLGRPVFLIPDLTIFPEFLFYLHPVDNPQVDFPSVPNRLYDFSLQLEGAKQGLTT